MSDSVARVRAALLAAGHADTISEFPEGTRTSQDAAKAVGCTVAQIAKSIVLRTGETVVLVIASGPNRVDLGKIAAALGEPVKFADGRFVRDVTGFAIGGVPPVGHGRAIRIFIDAELMVLDPVWAAAGSPRHVFRTGAQDLARMTGGTVTDVAKHSCDSDKSNRL
jgi:prolyl-tRNA editing enzyme YbaK/EbsC (Cys-tRNA(Pro) deacylase)